MSDAYRTLGISPSASDADVRVAYRRLVQRHHPDHNGGSPESARRFEEVQEAYAQIQRLRQRGAGDRRAASETDAPHDTAAAGHGTSASGPGAADPGLDARLAEMERELKATLAAREHIAREARRAEEQALRDMRRMAGSGDGERPSDEELGYVSTNDSFSKILDDAAAEFSKGVSDAGGSPAAQRVSDLIDELAAKLTGDPPPRR
ncbi:MAG: J domain-containing protein [Solirubrobacteraceae bacterium]